MDARLKRLTQVLLVLFGLLALRLVQFQLVQGRRYAELSDHNRIRKIALTAPRGRIFDRNGRTIADTRPSFTVSVIPTEMTDSTLPLLAKLLEVPLEDLESKVEPVAFLASPVKVRRNLSQEALFRVEENRFRLAGVRTSVDPVRSYPSDDRYCHVLGHLGEVNQEDLVRDSGYRMLDYIGRAGVEAKYEELLRGRDGYEYVEIDARGHEIGPLPEKRPVSAVAGRDIYLTIDDRLQQLAYLLTAEYQRAAVVGIKIASGEVICLHSRPGFDPNLFTGTISAEAWQELSENPSKPFYNRTISAVYPPGSVLKPVVALAALKDRVVRTGTRLQFCNGQYRYGNRTFKCWTEHGSLDLTGAIAHSCNVYFYQLGLRLGLDSLVSYCRAMPLGRSVGIDLPGENPGIIPSRDWLNQRYGRGRWHMGVLLNFAIGQGEILASPLQMAVTYAAIANNGVFRRPHVLARVDSAGRTVQWTAAEIEKVDFRSHDLTQVKRALEHVIEYGTARTARLREIRIAGKTGTAENIGVDHAWFVGYAPADRPEVVFAVLVENAGHGGVVAAPIARQLIRTWFSIPEAGRP